MDVMRRFVYLVDGEPFAGTVQNLAAAMRNATYSGEDVWSGEVFTFQEGQAVSHKVTTYSTGYNSDDWSAVTVEVLGDAASYVVDGRS